MPRRAPPKVEAWSYSRLSTYQQCPAKFKYQVIDKAPFTTNAAMQRGKDIHTLAEKFAKGTIKELPEELALFDEEFALVRELASDPDYELLIEQKWAFTRDWTATEYFAKDVWVRIIVDLGILNKKEGILTIIDHKTGKGRDVYTEQQRLYGTAGLSRFAGLQKINTELWFLDQGFINDETNEPAVVMPDEHEDLIKHWEDETRALFTDKAFRPTPNKFCGWCDFSQSNGGKCEF